MNIEDKKQNKNRCDLNPKKVEFKCTFCENVSILTRWEAKNKIFCSIKCCSSYTKKKKRKEITCNTCNKLFTVLGYMKNRAKYCSRSCFSKRENRIKNIIPKKIELNCKTCRKTYQVWNYRKKSMFCSRNCKHNYGRFFGTCKRCFCEFYEEKNVTKNSLIRKYFCKECVKYVPS